MAQNTGNIMIREIEEKDIAQIINIWRDSFTEASFLVDADFDEKGVEASLRRVLRDDTENVFVDVDGDTVIGFLKCYLGKISVTIHTGVFEAGFFIKPAFRGAGRAKALVNAMAEWGIANGAAGSMVQVISGVDGNADNLFVAMGYLPLGRNFVKWAK
jgi:GNAT superfamily N-acetyltransferase